MSVDIKMIEQLNAKAKALNSTRERQLGQQEAARTAYEKAVLVYKQKYGVELDDTNLQQEYDNVKNALVAEYEKLNNLVLSIESGEYKNDAPVAVIPPNPSATAQTAQASSVQAPQATPAQTTPVQATPAQLSQEAIAHTMQATQTQQPPQFGAGVQTVPQDNPVQPNPAPVQNPSSTPASSTEGEDISEQPFTPAGWGIPNNQRTANQQQTINQNFQNILNGNGLKFGQ